MLMNQHVLSWIGASHSSYPSNWMWDPSWAAAMGDAAVGDETQAAQRALSPTITAVAFLLAEKLASIAGVN